MVDLHLHSTCSDGQDTPEELVQIAADAGITVMALTDHDNINGIVRARRTAESLGIKLISGIEISASGNRELHILGYGVDPESQELKQFYEDNRAHRINRRDRLIELFNNAGIPLTLEKICEVNEGQSTGRPHIARALIEMGYAEDMQDAFDRYLKTPQFYCAERPKPEPEEGIAMIRRAGGAAVLAHPYLLRLGDSDFRQLLERLISCGLSGIECYYSEHTPEETAYYRRIADEYGLIYTIGSDYHGPDMKPDILPGTGRGNSLTAYAELGEEIVERLLMKIEAEHR